MNVETILKDLREMRADMLESVEEDAECLDSVGIELEYARKVISTVSATIEMIEAQQWRPIESAPKDGAVFDVWLGDATIDDLEFYCAPGTRRSPSWHWSNGKFRPFAGLECIPTFVRPTHWMPLPAAPEPKAEAE